MPDIVDSATRSKMMAGISGRNTKPELLIRRGLHANGFRFRLHRKDLPGKPDIVLPKYKTVVLVNGCFWHGHDCPLFKWPKTRPEFWHEKITGNIDRDRRNIGKLVSAGWRVAIIWECAVRPAKAEALADTMDKLIIWLRSEELYCEIAGK